MICIVPTKQKGRTGLRFSEIKRSRESFGHTDFRIMTKKRRNDLALDVVISLLPSIDQENNFTACLESATISNLKRQCVPPPQKERIGGRKRARKNISKYEGI